MEIHFTWFLSVKILLYSYVSTSGYFEFLWLIFYKFYFWDMLYFAL